MKRVAAMDDKDQIERQTYDCLNAVERFGSG